MASWRRFWKALWKPHWWADEVRLVAGEPEVLCGGVHHYGGSNDYKREGTTVTRIVDRTGRTVQAVWSADWTEVAPGVETRVGTLGWEVLVHARACPVRVRVRDVSEYVSWTDAEHNQSNSTEHWVRFMA